MGIDLTHATQIALCGAVGGVIALLVAWTPYAYGKSIVSPTGPHKAVYWIVAVSWIAVGGYMAYVLNDQQPITKLNATQAGLVAPLFIARILKTLDPRTPGSTDTEDLPTAPA